MGNREDLVDVILEVLERGDPEPITGRLTPSAVVWHNSDDVATPAATAFQQVRGLHALVDDVRVEVTRREPTSDGAVVQYVIRGVVRSSGSKLAARNCIITPHMAWGSLAARRRLMAMTVQNVEAFLAGRPINVVN